MATATPLLTTSFLNWIEKQDTKNLNFLEFGAGNSSIYFSNLFKYVISYEDNEDYVNKLNAMKIPNLLVKHFNFKTIENPSFSKSIAEADYILIDNTTSNISRDVVARNLISVYNYRNKIILDNGNWNPGAYFYLRKKYKNFLDFGWRNVEDEETITTIFWERRDEKT